MSKSIVEFVCHLRNLNINLETDGVSGAPLEEVRLRCHAPEGALTPTLRQEIAGRKTEIIQWAVQRQSHEPKFAKSIMIPINPQITGRLMKFLSKSKQHNFYIIKQL